MMRRTTVVIVLECIVFLARPAPMPIESLPALTRLLARMHLHSVSAVSCDIYNLSISSSHFIVHQDVTKGCIAEPEGASPRTPRVSAYLVPTER